MYTQKTRVRRMFTPLNVSVTAECATPNSPTAQVWNAQLQQHEPDRGVSPTVILPKVTASSEDGSWEEGNCNALLANMKWLADGEDISTQSEWANKYEISTEGETRGALTIKRNIAPGEMATLVFTAEILDRRTGTLYAVVSDPVTLTTTTKARDTWHISTRETTTQVYRPAQDRLAEYEYCRAHGIACSVATSEADATDKLCYRRKIPFRVYRGQSIATTGYQMSYWRLNEATGDFTEVTADSDEVVSLDNTQITLDLRFIAKATYLAIAQLADGTFLAQAEFSVARHYPEVNWTPTNETSVTGDESVRHDRVSTNSSTGQYIRHPEVFEKLTWMTDTTGKTEVAHNEGSAGLISMRETGINLKDNSDYLETYLDYEHKPPVAIATDAAGDVWTDENGEEFFFN